MVQSLSCNPIHIVFSTKNREAYFEDLGIRQEIWAFLGGCCKKLGCQAIKVGGHVDHIHILCHLSKNVSGSRLIGEIKRVSSIWIKNKGPQYQNFFWQSGYAYFAVGPRDTQLVVDYIENQQSHHATKDFKSELLYFLNKYNVEYDERYLWD